MVCVAGQNDHRDLVEQYFGSIDSAFELIPAKKVEYAQSFDRTTTKEGFEQSSLIISFGGDLIEQMVRDRAAVKVFNYIFGGAADSRLWVKIREELGLVYMIYSHPQETLEGSLFSIDTLAQKENVEQIIEVTDQEIKKMRSDPVSDDELTRAKNMIKSSMYRRMESSRGMSDREIERVVYNDLGFDEYIEAVGKIKAKDVADIADQIFSGSRYVQRAIGTK
jgi:predicted Zn-dependent peptidase